jgi:hypothetical protein
VVAMGGRNRQVLTCHDSKYFARHSDSTPATWKRGVPPRMFISPVLVLLWMGAFRVYPSTWVARVHSAAGSTVPKASNATPSRSAMAPGSSSASDPSARYPRQTHSVAQWTSPPSLHLERPHSVPTPCQPQLVGGELSRRHCRDAWVLHGRLPLVRVQLQVGQDRLAWTVAGPRLPVRWPGSCDLWSQQV